MKSEENSHKSLQMELLISQLLHWGVIISLVLIVAGTVLSFSVTHDYGPGGGSADEFLKLIGPDNGFTFSWLGLWQGLLSFRGQSIAVLGLLFLICTPLFRVLMSIVAFALERDRAYIAITGFVLLVMLLSFGLGRVG